MVDTPLHLAALNGHTKVAELLIKSGAHLNPKNKGSMTPLHAAAAKGHTKVAELLIKSGAHPNPKNLP